MTRTHAIPAVRTGCVAQTVRAVLAKQSLNDELPEFPNIVRLTRKAGNELLLTANDKFDVSVVEFTLECFGNVRACAIYKSRQRLTESWKKLRRS